MTAFWMMATPFGPLPPHFDSGGDTGKSSTGWISATVLPGTLLSAVHQVVVNGDHVNFVFEVVTHDITGAVNGTSMLKIRSVAPTDARGMFIEVAHLGFSNPTISAFMGVVFPQGAQGPSIQG